MNFSPCFTQFSIIFCSFSKQERWFSLQNLCVVADKKEKIDFIVIVTVEISQQWHRNDHHLVFLLCLSAESNRQKKSREKCWFLSSQRISLLSFIAFEWHRQGSKNFSDLICRHLDSFFYWYGESFSFYFAMMFLLSKFLSNVNKFFSIADFADGKFALVVLVRGNFEFKYFFSLSNTSCITINYKSREKILSMFHGEFFSFESKRFEAAAAFRRRQKGEHQDDKTKTKKKKKKTTTRQNNEAINSNSICIVEWA